MDYRDLLEQVQPQWRDDFERFIEDREPSSAFEEELDRNSSLQVLMDAAIERMVPAKPGDLRRIFWQDIDRVNEAVAETLERAIEERLATPGVFQTSGRVVAARSNADSLSAGVTVLEREIEELGTRMQAVSSAAPATRTESALLASTVVSEKIVEIANAIVQLAIRRAKSKV